MKGQSGSKGRLGGGLWSLGEKETPEPTFPASPGRIVSQGEIPEGGTRQNPAGLEGTSVLWAVST